MRVTQWEMKYYLGYMYLWKEPEFYCLVLLLFFPFEVPWKCWPCPAHPSDSVSASEQCFLTSRQTFLDILKGSWCIVLLLLLHYVQRSTFLKYKFCLKVCFVDCRGENLLVVIYFITFSFLFFSILLIFSPSILVSIRLTLRVMLFSLSLCLLWFVLFNFWFLCFVLLCSWLLH